MKKFIPLLHTVISVSVILSFNCDVMPVFLRINDFYFSRFHEMISQRY